MVECFICTKQSTNLICKKHANKTENCCGTYHKQHSMTEYFVSSFYISSPNTNSVNSYTANTDKHIYSR